MVNATRLRVRRFPAGATLLLFVSAFALYAFPPPTLFYAGAILLHAGLAWAYHSGIPARSASPQSASKIKAAENFPRNSAAQAVFSAPLPKAQRTGELRKFQLSTSQ
jgi:hypothetical protein